MERTEEYLKMYLTFSNLTLEQRVRFINDMCDILSKSNQIDNFNIIKIKE
jgi:hypothetical protein